MPEPERKAAAEWMRARAARLEQEAYRTLHPSDSRYHEQMYQWEAIRAAAADYERGERP